MTIRRLLFVQNGLAFARGHWLRETMEWKKGAEALQLEWLGFSHVNFDAQLAQTHGMRPAFPYRPHDYLLIKSDPGKSKLATLTELPKAFANACCEHFPNDTGSGDLLLVAFSTQKEMQGVAQWLAALPEERRPMVAFYVHHQDANWIVDSRKNAVEGDFPSWQAAGRALLQSLPPERIKIYTVDDFLAGILTNIMGIKVLAQPLVMKIAALPPEFSARAYDIAVLGGARKEQGIELAVATLAELAALRPGLKALVQVRAPEEAGALQHMAHPGIEIYCGHLYDEAFDARLRQTRFVFLPYVPDSYFLRSSGVFSEACCMGIPAATSDLTAMSRTIREGKAAGIVFDYWDTPSAIAQQLNAMLDKGEAFHQKAIELREGARYRHSGLGALSRIIGDFKTAGGL